jgi:hypothetical protein
MPVALNPEILAYIKDQRGAHVPDSDIRRELILNQWPITDHGPHSRSINR